MTEKELLYLEDVLNHLDDASKITNYYSNLVEGDLKEMLLKLSTDFKKLFEDGLGIIGG